MESCHRIFNKFAEHHNVPRKHLTIDHKSTMSAINSYNGTRLTIAESSLVVLRRDKGRQAIYVGRTRIGGLIFV